MTTLNNHNILRHEIWLADTDLEIHLFLFPFAPATLWMILLLTIYHFHFSYRLVSITLQNISQTWLAPDKRKDDIRYISKFLKEKIEQKWTPSKIQIPHFPWSLAPVYWASFFSSVTFVLRPSIIIRMCYYINDSHLSGQNFPRGP